VTLGRENFEARYAANPDPWEFETSAYEHEKYERTLAALGDRHYERAFEAGCSIGVFTAMLAERCDELLAVDIAQAAVDTARERLAAFDHVRVERRTLPGEWPAGPFDLVVCSEILYYWDRATLDQALGVIAASMAPGGRLIAVHYRPPSSIDPLTGDVVHALLRERLALGHVASEVNDQFRIDVFDA
jgi:SAM-dependent methyltransferase